MTDAQARTNPERNCATCCAFVDGSDCQNYVTWDHGNGPGEVPRPNDCCPSHKTWDEDRAEDDAISRFRKALGLPPRKG